MILVLRRRCGTHLLHISRTQKRHILWYKFYPQNFRLCFVEISAPTEATVALSRPLHSHTARTQKCRMGERVSYDCIEWRSRKRPKSPKKNSRRRTLPDTFSPHKRPDSPPARSRSRVSIAKYHRGASRAVHQALYVLSHQRSTQATIKIKIRRERRKRASAFVPAAHSS